jgi:hypothetical protein
MGRFARVAILIAAAAVGLLPRPAGGEAAEERLFLDDVQRRAVSYFWQRADPVTGLVTDRASNSGADTYDVASMAATGYGLSALAIGVERKWLKRDEAVARAEKTLKSVLTMPHHHGFLYHFVNKRTGERVWQSEISTIDTALFALGALTAGRAFGGDVRTLSERLHDRMDWRWALTNGGTKPGKLALTHGWRPETGFIASDWGSFCESTFLLLLALGSKQDLPAEVWTRLERPRYRYGGHETLAGGPIFWHQMTQGYYDLRNRRDLLGFDYWVAAEQAMDIHRAFCADNAAKRKTYRAGYWGLNAGDASGSRYEAFGVPAPEDGTVSPTGVLAAIPYRPKEALKTAMRMRKELGDRAWGRYGFCNQFNLEPEWFGSDVIGIDLGMALLNIENHRSGLVWKLTAALPATVRAYSKVGLSRTSEPGIRPLWRSRSGAGAVPWRLQPPGALVYAAARRPGARSVCCATDGLSRCAGQKDLAMLHGRPRNRAGLLPGQAGRRNGPT